MVKDHIYFILFLTILFFSVPVCAQSIKVNSEIDPNSAYENQPLQGTITITHEKTAKIDLDSFEIDKNKLKVNLVKQVEFSPTNPLMLSIYSFQLPAKPQGLYALPAVSVKIDGQKYSSIMSSYAVQEVRGKAVPQDKAPVLAPASFPAKVSLPVTSSNSDRSSAPILRLKASVDGPNSLYPGQRTRLVYRYYYIGNIELTVEMLPLLDAEGMTKIGEKDIKDSTEDNISVTEISQVVEAVKPGDYSFGPSVIEGFAYQEDASGKHNRTSEKLSSTAPPITVTVLPFPQENRPSSFNGAIGKYQITVSLKSPADVKVGDEMTLDIDITANSNIQNVPLPDVGRQPGFEGFFRLSDLPPQESVEGNTKKVTILSRPLSAEVHEIPSIEFSSFDPGAVEYYAVHSEPISITVRDIKDKVKPIETPPKETQVIKPKETPIEQEPPLKPKTNFSSTQPVEIEGIYKLTESDLYNEIGGSWWVMALIPIGVALLLYQYQIHEYLEKERKKAIVLTSRDLLNQALHYPAGSSQYFDGLNRSLMVALVEGGQLSSADIAIDDLPKKGLAGEVRNFLCDIEEKRFAGREFAGRDVLDYESVNVMARTLVEKILSKTTPI